MIARLAGLLRARSCFQSNSSQKPRWNAAKPRLCTPPRRTSSSAPSMAHPFPRRGDTHIAMRATNTSVPAASWIPTRTGSS